MWCIKPFNIICAIFGFHYIKVNDDFRNTKIMRIYNFLEI